MINSNVEPKFSEGKKPLMYPNHKGNIYNLLHKLLAILYHRATIYCTLLHYSIRQHNYAKDLTTSKHSKLTCTGGKKIKFKDLASLVKKISYNFNNAKQKSNWHIRVQQCKTKSNWSFRVQYLVLSQEEEMENTRGTGTQN